MVQLRKVMEEGAAGGGSDHMPDLAAAYQQCEAALSTVRASQDKGTSKGGLCWTEAQTCAGCSHVMVVWPLGDVPKAGRRLAPALPAALPATSHPCPPQHPPHAHAPAPTPTLYPLAPSTATTPNHPHLPSISLPHPPLQALWGAVQEAFSLEQGSACATLASTAAGGCDLKDLWAAAGVAGTLEAHVKHVAGAWGRGGGGIEEGMAVRWQVVNPAHTLGANLRSQG
jgi:hypothetical protein